MYISPKYINNLSLRKMRFFYSFLIASLAVTPGAIAQSNLLENVKRNPEDAKALCNQLRNFNSQGISAGSQKAIEEISRKRNLSKVDAEILSIYVIGLHCPDVN